MSFKQGTEHYNLPQYAPEDTPSWVQDMTGAFKKIDTTMYQIADQSNTSSGAVENLQQSVANLTTTVTKNTQDIGNAQTDIDNNYTELKNADTQLSNRIAANTANITAHTQQIAVINEQLEDLQPEPIEEIKNDVNALKATVGNTSIDNIADGTLTGGLVSVDNAQGLETRVNPDDALQPQWRVKGSEGEWANFKKALEIIEKSYSGSFSRANPYQIPTTITENEKTYNIIGVKNFSLDSQSTEQVNHIVVNITNDWKISIGYGGQHNPSFYIIGIYQESD